MKGILKYVRWLWSHSVGARASILVNILLGTLTVGLNLLFIFLCKSSSGSWSPPSTCGWRT